MDGRGRRPQPLTLAAADSWRWSAARADWRGPAFREKIKAMIAADAPVEWFDEIDSTQAEARRRAERGECGPVWLVAGRQTAGRGRRGRAWVSRLGNLLATYLGPADAEPAEIALLGFACGLAIAEAVETAIGAENGGARVSLKWPNDVMLGGAKIAGILTDSAGAPGGGRWLALAFGVNLAEAPEGLGQPAACLADALPAGAATPDSLHFLAAVRARLGYWTAILREEGFAPVRAAWLARAHGLGRQARIGLGETHFEGQIAGLSPQGELELQTSQGLIRISAGDLELVTLQPV